jgi:hypothetical protein
MVTDRRSSISLKKKKKKKKIIEMGDGGCQSFGLQGASQLKCLKIQ